ncbi:MAG: hypothetical protein ACP5E3_15155, partial [Bacteroidales bacterium]
MINKLHSKHVGFKKRLGFVTLGVFIATLSFSQTILFSDAVGENVTLGSESHVSIVNNPILDGVNGSSKSLLSDGAAWAGYTINCSVPISASNNKLYISFYNPNGFTENQVQLNFENPNQQWLTEAHPAGSADGWYERVIDLSSFEGETLTWLWIAPSAGEAGQVYFDNIYLSDTPSDDIKQPFMLSPTAVIFDDAAGDYVTLGSEDHVSVVSNPLPDNVNGSASVLLSEGGSWAGYTINMAIPVTDTTDKLYISFYNPNGLTENQVQINFQTPNQQWLSETYPSGATNGWYEREIDLSSFMGDTLTWMWIAASAGEAGVVYFDNIYLGDAPSDEIKQPFYISTTAVVFDDAAGEHVTLGSEEHVAALANPVKDTVNGSPTSLMSDGGAWAGYTIHCAIPVTDTTKMLYISFYNPNGLTENQVQLNFVTPNQQWLTEAFPSEAANGWYERVIDLSSFIGDTLSWMWIAPSGGETGKVYFDNIYLDDASNEEITMPFLLSTTGIIFMDEAGEGVELGTEEHVAIVNNPMKDDVNNSETVLKSDATASWSGYTITCNIPV